MKKILLITVTILSFTLSFGNNNFINHIHENGNIDSLKFVNETDTHAPFDFDYKAYLPKDFNAYDLTTNETDSILMIDEEVDEPFDFDHKAYLPVGFNPSIKFNELYLKDVNWVDEETDETLDFNHKEYLPIGFNPSKELNHLFLNELPWIDEEEID